VLAWLRLIRASGLFTIYANILASVACLDLGSRALGATVWRVGADQAVWVVVASGLFLASGMLWNDLLDVERDRTLNPKRPLPSGRITLPAALIVGVLIPAAAFACCVMLGWRGMYAGGIVLVLALLYDAGAKHLPWIGSLVMASVRGAHAIFALLLVGDEYFDRAVLGVVDLFAMVESGDGVPIPPIYPGLLFVYVFGVTLASELESRPSRRWELIFAGAMMLLPLTAIWAWAWRDDRLVGASATPWYGIALAAAASAFLAWRLIRRWFHAIRTGERRDVPPLIIAGLGGIILFDAALAATFDVILGAIVLALYVPFLLVGKLIRMD